VHLALVVTGIVIVVAWLVGWLVARFHSRAGTTIALVAQILARLVVVGAMAYSTTRAVDRGGWFVVLAVVLALIGAAALVMAAVMAAALWMSLTGRIAD
jgi:hypothetical protein